MMGKSVGKKTIAMLVFMGIILLSVCIFNMVALKVIRDCNEQAKECFMAYREALVSGDAKLASGAVEAIMGNGSRIEMSINNVGIFNVIELVVVMLLTAVIIIVAALSIAGPAQRADRQLQAIENSIESSGRGAEGISGVIKRLLSGMEKMAAATRQFSQSCEKNIKAVVDISFIADEGSGIAAGIKERAEAMRRQTIENKDTAINLVKDASRQLEQTAREDGCVAKIDELAGDIMGIAGHMDLLALNISIDALRAGEAGKGFVTAADGIRQLAGKSRDTADELKKISGGARQTVELLGENAGDILRFIGEDVVKVYDDFENIAGWYAGDSDALNDILHDFADKASDMKDMMQKLGEDIKKISAAVEKDADDMSQAAVEAQELAQSMAEIKDELHRI